MKKLRNITLCLTVAAILVFFAVPAFSANSEDASGRSGIGKMSLADIRNLYGSITSVSSMYDVAPVTSGSSYRPSVLAAEAYLSAQDWINYYRSVAGLDTISFTDDLNTSASYGALVMTMNDKLSHTPDKPASMSQTDYSKAYSATSSSNISYSGSSAVLSPGYVIYNSVSGQMEDEDATNISRVGHRRWLLNPATITMGFGSADAVYNGLYKYYSDVRVFGTGVSTANVSDYDFIAWPASGYNLTDTFPSSTPWSISLNPARFKTPYAANVKVTLTRESDGKTWTFSNKTNKTSVSASYDFFTVDTSNIGVNNAIIFRPAYSDITNYMGRYQVNVSGIYDSAGVAKTLSYTVNFAPYNGDINSCGIAVESGTFRYNGNAFKPAVTVTCKSAELKEGTDYIVEYSNDINAGTASVKITGIGDYYGECTKTFEILSDNPLITFNANGGSSAPANIQADDDNKATIPSQLPSRYAYNFRGWSADRNAAKAEYKPGDDIEVSEDTDLYAVWADAYEILDDETPCTIESTFPGMTSYVVIKPAHDCDYIFKTSSTIRTDFYKNNKYYAYATVPYYSGLPLELKSGVTYCIAVKYSSTTATGSFNLTLTHQNTVSTKGTAATCTSSGISDSISCSNCGKVFKSAEIIPALGHDYVGKETKKASCNATGVMTYTCTHDKSHKYTEVIPKTDHTPEVLRAVAATCTETGLTEGSKCSVCGEILKKQEVIPALGHDYKSKVTKEATCTEMVWSGRRFFRGIAR